MGPIHTKRMGLWFVELKKKMLKLHQLSRILNEVKKNSIMLQYNLLKLKKRNNWCQFKCVDYYKYKCVKRAKKRGETGSRDLFCWY